MHEGPLDGKVALVTGAGSGIGLASSIALAEAGALVCLSDLDGAAAKRGVAEIEAVGGAAVAYEVDASSVDAIEQLLLDVDQAHGGLDILFNNVGAPGPAGLDISEDAFDHLVNVNMKSHFFATKFAVPLLARRGGGSIIFNASVSGLVGSKAGALYGMTKGGVELLMRSVARQVGSQGIRANAVCPGPTRTPQLAKFVDPTRQGLEGEELDRQLAARDAAIPLGRMANPEDVARVVVFLASPQSGYLTGVSVPVDGGMLA